MNAFESQHAGSLRKEWHRHRNGYAALVLDGGYEEMSIEGRFGCKAGMIVVHPPYHVHANRFMPCGAAVLNIPIPPMNRHQVFYCPHASRLERLARRSAASAAIEIVRNTEQGVSPSSPANGWIAALAERLCQEAVHNARTPLKIIAEKIGISQAHMSRAFRRHYGMTPSEFRQELRFQHLLPALLDGADLALAAQNAGYADQSHMTRDVRRRAGRTPSQFTTI